MADVGVDAVNRDARRRERASLACGPHGLHAQEAWKEKVVLQALGRGRLERKAGDQRAVSRAWILFW